MPGSTPTRSYPFPLDSEVIDVTGDIENLAVAVDADANSIATDLLTEQAARIDADQFHKVQGWFHGAYFDTQIALMGGYVEATLDGFAVHVLEFPETFGFPPIVTVTPAASTQTIDVGVEHTTTTTCNVFGRIIESGEPAYFGVVAYYWLAVGPLPAP